MEKNIWEYVMNSKGEVIEKVADYIGVESFAKTIENLYNECLENFDDADDLRMYIADGYGMNIQAMAWEFALEVNREMKKNTSIFLISTWMAILLIYPWTTLSTLQVFVGHQTTMETITTTCILRW